jgi:hypothetical protein
MRNTQESPLPTITGLRILRRAWRLFNYLSGASVNPATSKS